MKTALAGIAMITLLSASAAAAESPGCALHKLGEAHLQSQPDGTWLIPARIMGHDTALVLDTAGTVGTVTRNYAAKLDLTRHRLPIIESEQGTLGMGDVPDNFIVAGIHSQIIPLYFTETQFANASGAFTTNVLGQYDQDLDFAAGKLTLYMPGRCGTDAVQWPHEAIAVVPFHTNGAGQIVIPVTLQGKSVDAVLDSASPASHMSTEATKTFGLNAYAGFTSVSLEGVSINTPKIAVTNDGETSRPYLFLGASVLRHFHIYVDTAQHQLYITAAH